ncbi:hypothetical protein [Streptomyces sp. NPDC006638]|uniref:hypothetical protein n=1 Tax=Streptomyces sp. NPDC006638 TaxID=3157183 RepID=UPI0033A2E59C
MTTEPEHTDPVPVPDLTIPLADADARALGDDVGQLGGRCTPARRPGRLVRRAGQLPGRRTATAQSRRDTLLKKDPSEMERWATGSTS